MPLLFGCVVGAGMLNYEGWMGTQGAYVAICAGRGHGLCGNGFADFNFINGEIRYFARADWPAYFALRQFGRYCHLGCVGDYFNGLGAGGAPGGVFIGVCRSGIFISQTHVPLVKKDRWFAGIMWLAVCGLGADWSGLHFMVGAFLAGAVMDADWFNQEHMDLLRHHLLLTVMPVFFLSTGLRTNWDVGGMAVFGVAAILLVASIAGKLAGVHLAGKWLRWAPGRLH